MKQKMAYMSIGVVFTLIVSFTWLSFASSSSEVVGTLTALDENNRQLTIYDGKNSREFTVDADTIIYRDNQKTQLSALLMDDDLKVLLNSDQKVRYVVAASHRENADSTPNTVAVKAVTTEPVTKQAEEQVEKPIVKEIPIRRAADSQTDLASIRELEIELKVQPGHKYQLKYKNKDGEVESKWEVKGKQKAKKNGYRNAAEVEAFIKKLGINPQMDKQELAERVIAAFQLEHGFRELEVEIEFSNGREVELEIENKADRKVKYKEKYANDDDDDDDD
ncbi:hypothetical protein BEP19_04370 [Ammoniphilus oxalaticus]|uniref:Uncharacterized protein n=1 Tax=Ammoniphilus oxalaticus TaxID=66863 RepID=A0A419SLU7_9BACL|nr:YusW family protein [Ammoniphilus oxalaticus]RKD25063.1 hypothetical protein BEP19_04370 [Ammoniphilus oxalaticus]